MVIDYRTWTGETQVQIPLQPSTHWETLEHSLSQSNLLYRVVVRIKRKGGKKAMNTALDFLEEMWGTNVVRN